MKRGEKKIFFTKTIFATSIWKHLRMKRQLQMSVQTG